jgi:hypothetical protein
MIPVSAFLDRDANMHGPELLGTAEPLLFTDRCLRASIIPLLIDSDIWFRKSIAPRRNTTSQLIA